MRQVGTLPSEQDAHRLANYLVTQGVTAHAENEPAGWVIWVRDENHLDQAKEELGRFAEDPADSRYDGAESAAETIRQQELQKREAGRKNVVEMRGRWNRPTLRRHPLVVTLIGLSVLVAIGTNAGNARQGAVMRKLAIADIVRFYQDGPEALVEVRNGEIWRVVTPIFIPFGIIHLLFNMYWLNYLGGQIEERGGRWRLALLVLTIAVASNLAQFFIGEFPDIGVRKPLFGGMSGVVYGLLGYIWMKIRFDPWMGLHISRDTVFLMIGWLLLCYTGVMGSVANTAHAVGLGVGITIGYLPTIFRSSSDRQAK